MRYKEQHRDLFSVDFKKYRAVHCISLDCKMGAGIAVQMKKRFKLGGLSSFIISEKKKVDCPVCVYHNGVYNLITKKKYWHKPTYQTLRATLEQMRTHVIEEKVKHIAMPKIGSGLDKLSWPLVREIIQDVFEDVDIEILVCCV